MIESDVGDPADDPVEEPETVPAPPGATAPVSESAEVLPEMQLTVDSACNNPKGRSVGLSMGQRLALDVEVGETVELFDGSGANLGTFTVGRGAQKLLLKAESFTANEVDVGSSVKVRKAPKKGPA